MKYENTQYGELMKELAANKYAPIYLIMGEEPYFIDQLTSFIEKNALPQADWDFNRTVFYGKDQRVVNIIHEAEQFPLMAEKRLVILKEAQELDTAESVGGDKKHFQDFSKYIDHAPASSILVISYKGKVDKRSKLYTSADKHGVVFESKQLYDNQMPAWIGQYIRQQKLQADERAIILLAENVGTNLSTVAQMVEKLKVVCDDAKTNIITADMVEKHVAMSNQFTVFALRDALLQKNVAKANKIVDVFARNEKKYPIQATIATLFPVFRKLFIFYYVKNQPTPKILEALGDAPYTLDRIYRPAAQKYTPVKCMQIIDLLREYDMKSKGYNSPNVAPGDLLRELTFRILH